MDQSVILTLIGADRPGLVRLVANRATAFGANWLESRMASLAGRFAGVVHLTVPQDRVAELEESLQTLRSEGLQIIVERGSDVALPVGQRVHLDLVGHDHPGIVDRITWVLAQHGVTIEGLATDCEPAPMSGVPLFRASAELGVPEAADLDVLTEDLEAIAHELMVDLSWETVVPSSASS